MHTRRIHINSLAVAIGINAQNTVSGRLRFIGGNTDFLSKQMVNQCRLTYVRTTYDGNKATVFILIQFNIQRHALSCKCSKAAVAAACSALRRLVPVPLKGSSIPSTEQFTVNCWL